MDNASVGKTRKKRNITNRLASFQAEEFTLFTYQKPLKFTLCQNFTICKHFSRKRDRLCQNRRTATKRERIQIIDRKIKPQV